MLQPSNPAARNLSVTGTSSAETAASIARPASAPAPHAIPHADGSQTLSPPPALGVPSFHRVDVYDENRNAIVGAVNLAAAGTIQQVSPVHTPLRRSAHQ